MTWEQLRGVYMPILSGKGLRPEIDGEGDIHFKTQDGDYYITGGDRELFILQYPAIWEISGPGELSRALLAMSKVNRTTKLAKLTISEDMEDVHAMADFLQRDPAHIGQFIERAIEAIQQAVGKFRSEMQRD